MTNQVFNIVLLCSAASFGAAFVAAAALLFRISQVSRSRIAPTEPLKGRTIFLTEGRNVIDATKPARDYLALMGSDTLDYECLERILNDSFPDFSSIVRQRDGPATSPIVSADRSRSLAISREGPRLRLELRDAEDDIVEIDRGCHASLEAELNTLRTIGDGLPYPVWRQDEAGVIRWANAAYLDLVRESDPPAAATWPPPAVFDGLDTSITQQRIQIAHMEGSDQGWFDCTCMPSQGDVMVSACPADALMAAETSLRDSVQTFSRTFAQLTVGMAVFDKRRRLQLFNPALTELTTLPVDLLISSPTLDSFLDALRSRRMMPEPKNYSSWRDAVARVERAAADGTYSEMWHLPGNRTYRVTGRPQYDGAFALLIEDISAEISLTRRFRTEIRTGHAILNSLDEAICVFDSTGILLLSNSAYDELWKIETPDGVQQLTIFDALATWRKATAATSLWDEAQTFLSHDTERMQWSQPMHMLDGRPFLATLSPLPGGATVVRFSETMSARSGDLLSIPREDGGLERLKA